MLVMDTSPAKPPVAPCTDEETESSRGEQFISLLNKTQAARKAVITITTPATRAISIRNCLIFIIRRSLFIAFFGTSARGESRTLMRLPPIDFESIASAIPPPGHCYGEYKKEKKMANFYPPLSTLAYELR